MNGSSVTLCTYIIVYMYNNTYTYVCISTYTVINKLVTVLYYIISVSCSSCRAAVEFLSTEEHIHSTTDEDHFRSTDT